MDSGVHIEKTILDGVLHRIDDRDEFISFTLCYPHLECREFEDRLDFLRDNGFEYFIEYGGTFLKYRIIGKGYSSINILAYNRFHGLGLLKIRRIDSRRETLEYEGIINEYLNPTGVVPSIYMWSRDFIFREYLWNCRSVEKELSDVYESGYVDKVIYLLKKVLFSLHLIDVLRVDHGELNRPYNHIFICDQMDVKIIDWESSSFVRKPGNVSSFISYLLYRSSVFKDMAIDLKKTVNKYTRLYKANYSIKPLLEIIKLLREHLLQHYTY